MNPISNILTLRILAIVALIIVLSVALDIILAWYWNKPTDFGTVLIAMLAIYYTAYALINYIWTGKVPPKKYPLLPLSGEPSDIAVRLRKWIESSSGVIVLTDNGLFSPPGAINAPTRDLIDAHNEIVNLRRELLDAEHD